ncbi:MBL fold metallo-hydrolase [Bdellovibrio sp. HCB288]|uniref:MBL fold metallo-hydrolase n=1 Tax=Bdellovibrio sp. HCB288 TaxID=3394355 RepID=UPI0039B4B727
MAVRISRIFHAGYVFESGGVRIAFDPIFENPFSRNCFSFPEIEFDLAAVRQLRFDAVFVSHFHDDHCSFDSLKLLNRATPIYMFCVHEEMFSWIRELGFKNVHSLVLNSSVSIGDFEVISRPALDVDVDSLFQIRVQGLNILNVVDSWIDEDTFANLVNQGPWDLVMWPFQMMRELEVLEPYKAVPADRKLPEEWLTQLKILNPKNIIPSSCQFRMEEWSWYNHAFFPISYADFHSQVISVLPAANIINLTPASGVLLGKDGVQTCESLPWIKVLGNPKADYQYVPDLKPPSTASIAGHFAKLSDSQIKQVNDYCDKGILEKFLEIGPSADTFFNKRRIWKLSVFSKEGVETVRCYELSDDQMKPIPASGVTPDWCTEVTDAKLHSALNTGESLSSLYIRVVKDSDIDAVEDPLIRCLFSAEFGSYQKAQLARIKKEEVV